MNLTVYTDGSMDEYENAGAGFCIFRGSNTKIARGKVPLGRKAEVYDAEILGATEGLKAAVAHVMAKYATNFTVCLDNEEAALRLRTGIWTQTSSKQIAEFQALRDSGSKRVRTSATLPGTGTVNVRWVPGHAGIIGDERADALAKSSCGEPTRCTEASVSRAKRLLNERYEENRVAYWHTGVAKPLSATDISAFKWLEEFARNYNFSLEEILAYF